MDEDKRYLTAQELLNDSFELGLRIFKSGFRPSFIIGVWRGGTPVGIAVQEILDHEPRLTTASKNVIKRCGSTGWNMSSGMRTGKTVS
jgi:hypoxanthine phosphoribosyltransferase